MHFPKDLISVSDLSREQISELLKTAENLKKNRFSHEQSLKGKTVGVFTTKPSLRTRLSFEIGLAELGANSLFIRNDEIGLGTRESYADVGRVISRYLAALIVRSHDHQGLAELAKYSSISIINALTEQEHPCQALADLLTIQEKCGQLKDIKMTYIGDGNNVAVSLMLASAIMGLKFTAITPQGYEPPKLFVDKASQLAKQNSSAEPIITNEISEALKSDILYTDVWISMGQEINKEKIKSIFGPYRIDSELLKSNKIPVLHCLPAHKDEEISKDVFEENAELIFDQAENRLHMQKAILMKILR